MKDTVAICTPTIPPRRAYLMRAMASAYAQTHQASEFHVASDHRREGAGPTRNRTVRAVGDAEWIAFLDDDDEMLPMHLDHLIAHAKDTEADLVYPWFTVIHGNDPFPQFFGKPWDPENPHLFGVTVLLKASVAKHVVDELGGFPAPPPGLMGYPTDPAPTEDVGWSGDDWPFWLKVFGLGVKVEHLAERTWLYHHDSNNTSGLPSRW